MVRSYFTYIAFVGAFISPLLAGNAHSLAEENTSNGGAETVAEQIVKLRGEFNGNYALQDSLLATDDKAFGEALQAAANTANKATTCGKGCEHCQGNCERCPAIGCAKCNSPATRQWSPVSNSVNHPTQNQVNPNFSADLQPSFANTTSRANDEFHQHQYQLQQRLLNNSFTTPNSGNPNLWNQAGRPSPPPFQNNQPNFVPNRSQQASWPARPTANNHQHDPRLGPVPKTAKHQLRETAFMLDKLAHGLEMADLTSEADQVRRASNELRKSARKQSSATGRVSK